MMPTVRAHVVAIAIATGSATQAANPAATRTFILAVVIAAIAVAIVATVVIMRRGMRPVAVSAAALVLYLVGTLGILASDLVTKRSVSSAVWWVSLLACAVAALWMFRARP